MKGKRSKMPKRVLILGADGYIGWGLCLNLLRRGFEVYAVDNFSRRRNVEEVGSWSATPIRDLHIRLGAAKKAFNNEIHFIEGDLAENGFIQSVVKTTPIPIPSFIWGNNLQHLIL